MRPKSQLGKQLRRFSRGVAPGDKEEEPRDDAAPDDQVVYPCPVVDHLLQEGAGREEVEGADGVGIQGQM
eukprot:3875930-Pyramimonas_sp.AAC.1